MKPLATYFSLLMKPFPSANGQEMFPQVSFDATQDQGQ